MLTRVIVQIIDFEQGYSPQATRARWIAGTHRTHASCATADSGHENSPGLTSSGNPLPWRYGKLNGLRQLGCAALPSWPYPASNVLWSVGAF